MSDDDIGHRKPAPLAGAVPPSPIPYGARHYVRWGAMWHIANEGAPNTLCNRKIGANPMRQMPKPGGMSHCQTCFRNVK